MALPTLQNLKDFLRIETTDEDTALTAMLAQVTGLIEQYLGRPIVKREVTVTDRARPCTGVVKLLGFVCPIDSAATITVKDRDDVTVAATAYTVDYDTAVFYAEPGDSFGNPPYTLTFTAGLSARADYGAVVEPAISSAILDLAAERWRRRVPGVTQASSAGDSESYGSDAIPARIKLVIDSFRLRQV